jgi:hypothetical protein
MEFLSVLLSILLAVVSPAGFVADKVVADAIRQRFESVEQLQVRIDNTPSYQLAQGKVERVRIAGRGMRLTPEIRIAVLEVETDPIDVDVRRLRRGGKTPPLEALRKPVQAMVRLVLTEEDINRALQSPEVASRLRNLGTRLAGGAEREGVERYEILNPRVELLENSRLRFSAEIQERGEPERLAMVVESGVRIVSGRRLELTEPVVLVNGEPAPARLVTGLASGVSRRSDTGTLERYGITARLLQLNVTPDELELAAFARVERR